MICHHSVEYYVHDRELKYEIYPGLAYEHGYVNYYGAGVESGYVGPLEHGICAAAELSAQIRRYFTARTNAHARECCSAAPQVHGCH